MKLRYLAPLASLVGASVTYVLGLRSALRDQRRHDG